MARANSVQGRVRRLAPLVLLVLLAMVAPGGAGGTAAATDGGAGDATAGPGAAIYRDGVLPSGAPLLAEQQGDAPLRGPAAACVNCHQPSGLGTYEGPVLVPPIIGPYLLRDGATNVRDLSLPHIPGYTPNAFAYSPQSLARTLKTGMRPDGRVLSPLMPRYAFSATELVDLLAYLGPLSQGPVPGVGPSELQFATVIAPDADPAQRDDMLAVLRAFVSYRNGLVGARVPGGHSADTANYRVARTWRLHVWTLVGPPASWEAQLREKQQAEPVFALLSGIGASTWAPVHHFCERAHVPCLFPNVPLPVVAEGDFYPVYFSRGVLLEADLIGRQLGQATHPQGSRIVQVYREGDVGAAAASALARDLSGTSWSIVSRSLPALRGDAATREDRAALARARTGVRRDDVLVLWLRPRDIAGLEGTPPARVYASGEMAGLEAAPFPGAWRGAVQMAYPYDSPGGRRIRMNFPEGWMRAAGLPVRADPVQSDTWLACEILADVLDAMLDSYVQDFLVERLEIMLSQRLSTGFYPRLGLARHQRFASKGGYIVVFSGDAGNGVQPMGEWTVP